MDNFKRERGIFKLNQEKGELEKVEPKLNVNLLEQELHTLEDRANKGPLSLDDERRLWELKKKTGKIDISKSEPSTGQYL